MLGTNNPFATRLKMLAHSDRLAQWAATGDTFPVLIEINPTNYCNEACDWCISKNAHLGNTGITGEERRLRIQDLERHSAISNHPERGRGIELPCLSRFLRQAKAMGLRAVNWSGGGEPTGYAHFREGVQCGAELGLDQGLLTNGLFPASHVPVIGDHLLWVRVSLDTLDATKYEAYKHARGFDQVVRNIERLVMHPVQVIVNMNLAQWNMDEIEQVAHWSRDVGASSFQVRPTLGLPFDSLGNAPYRRQPTRDWLVRVKESLVAVEQLRSEAFDVLVSWDKFDDLERSDFGRSYTKCLYHFFICVLNANGNLCVCMYHLNDERFTFGNIYLNSVDEIWNSLRRKDVVAMCANALDLSTCQVCCKGHEINKFMHELETVRQRADVNFL